MINSIQRVSDTKNKTKIGKKQQNSIKTSGKKYTLLDR